ncbi:hypothetical protein NSS64_28070 [Paenibacillus sp. FSL H8-0122]|uniref:hypothetical protein n=1 Tax=unclassified Paenibacillus TaxID=185978 RepID=UPI0030F6A330
MLIVSLFSIIQPGNPKVASTRQNSRPAAWESRKTAASWHTNEAKPIPSYLVKKQKSDTRRPGALFIFENNINFHYKPMQ